MNLPLHDLRLRLAYLTGHKPRPTHSRALVVLAVGLCVVAVCLLALAWRG